jgi:hypothetical protein
MRNSPIPLEMVFGVTEPSVHTLLGEIVRSPCDQAVEDSLTVVRDMTGLFLGGNSFRRDHPAHTEFCDNKFAPACADDFQIPSYCWEAGLGIIAIFSLPGE